MAVRSMSESLARPTVLWCIYLSALAAAALGLLCISQRGLALDRAQRIAQRSKELEQKVRIALWRLDSRVASEISMLHDNRSTRFEPHIRDRFQLLEISHEKGTPSALQMLPERTPVDEIVKILPPHELSARVENLLPDEVQIASNYQGQLTNFAFPSSPVQQTFRAFQVQTNIGSQMQLQSLAPINSGAFLVAPFWLNDQLLLVRTSNDHSLDCVWLNWDSLKESLLEDLSDLDIDLGLAAVLPNAEPDPTRAMAALPVELSAALSTLPVATWSPMQSALMIAWLALLLAGILSALALRYLIDLSERRSMFVSAVTHELRTPLTTFRLYSDLLARGTIADPDDQQQYLRTLQTESDRLNHLIDNVLSYSRLEKSAPLQKQEIELSEWLAR